MNDGQAPSFQYLCIYASTYLPVYLFNLFISFSICLSTYLPAYLSIYLAIYLASYLSSYLSIYSISPSIHIQYRRDDRIRRRAACLLHQIAKRLPRFETGRPDVRMNQHVPCSTSKMLGSGIYV